MRAIERQAELQSLAEQSYDKLDGEWLDWLEVTKRFEHKVPYQDRLDIRHTIILELALARQKTTEPIPLYRAYRIASYMVADYYRQQLKLNTGLDCRHCSKAKRQECKEHDLYSECPKLIKLVSLDTITIDAKGNSHTLRDTIADDNALKEVSALKGSKANLDGAQMTLEEARLDFIRAQDAEVEKRAADRFEKLKGDYESKMPQLVYQRLRDILKQPGLPKEIAKPIDTEAKKKADAILRDPDNWPPWFRELYEEEVEKKVNAGLNQEFNDRVETAAITRARQRLRELTATEWPEWYQINVAPKIAELEININTGALQLLVGPWVFTCDQCGASSNAELTAGEIEQLLREGLVRIECSNAACEDSSWFSRRRHTFTVSLHKLIESHIPSGP